MNVKVQIGNDYKNFVYYCASMADAVELIEKIEELTFSVQTKQIGEDFYSVANSGQRHFVISSAADIISASTAEELHLKAEEAAEES